VVVAVLAVGCSSSDGGTSPTTAATTTAATTTTTTDPVAAAESRVAAAQSDLAAANDALKTASQQFCTEAKDYVTAVDRYGKLFTDSKATVGDVKTAGADLAAPRDSVSSAATAVSSAKSDAANADKDLTDAQNALALAKATASSVPAPATSPPPTTTTLVSTATINNVQRAEDDLAKTSAGITDATPLTEATAEYNSAALELEVAWLQLLLQAGCFSAQQQADAAAQLLAYTTALQTDLQTAGYYKGAIDGIYGPDTVAAVKQLQTDNDLPVTGLVDEATARALDAKLAQVGQQAASQQLTQTAALQTVLKLTGFWTGPIDGMWTAELTDALKRFQTKLGVPPTGAVDAATIAAFQVALATVKQAATTTTTTPPATTPTTVAPPPTRTAPTRPVTTPTSTSTTQPITTTT
jgi:peptidoglycan hydrolase-like protein with peptidoglycan-binding domain